MADEFRVAFANALAKKLDEEIISSLVDEPNTDETLKRWGRNGKVFSIYGNEFIVLFQ